MKKTLLTCLVLFSVVNNVNAKSLVVFYRLTGTTKELAQRISKESQSDIFELELENPYSTNRIAQAHRKIVDVKKFLNEAGIAMKKSVKLNSGYEMPFQKL
ncbi:MAG: hypothetical protein KBT11_10415 [Treponema sp.]|nr:hypothetical protein [Candidatus Treponema equifaecale]